MIDTFMKVRLECPCQIGSILNKILLPLLILTFTSICLPLNTYGAEVTLAWDANIEEDLDGYVLYYGIDSGVYTEAVDVGNITEYSLTGLEEDVVYYFAVTAYNRNDNESKFSEELSHVISGKTTVLENDHPDVPDTDQDHVTEAEALATRPVDTGGCFIYSIIEEYHAVPHGGTVPPKTEQTLRTVLIYKGASAHFK